MKRQLERIENLKQQLHVLGYQPWQLDMIVQDAIGTHIINENSQEQVEQVAEILEGYVSFAAGKVEI